MHRKDFLSGKKIKNKKIKKNLSVKELVDDYYQAYNSARLNEACRLMVEKMLDPKRDVAIGLTMAGALTPAGMSGQIVSMMERGFIDFIISTGANLYHDIHFAMGKDFHKGHFEMDDLALGEVGVARIYDILFDDVECPAAIDLHLKKFLFKTRFKRPISTSEFHHELGKFLLKECSHPEGSILAQAAKYNIPVYTSSPADSLIGINIGQFRNILDKRGVELVFDTTLDLYETAAIVAGAKENGAIILGGGSPKNFYMQTQPMLFGYLGVNKGGHNYFIQITTDSPQWGGLSGATPKEAVSWGKINPKDLPNSVVVYADVTLAAPIFFSYAITLAKPRKQKKLYQKREELINRVKKEFLKKGGINFEGGND